MARFNKIQVISKSVETGIVPIFYHKDIEVAKQVVKACYEGGIRVFEFTNRGDFASEVFGELVKFAQKECPDMIMGVGSIVDAPTAALYIQLGANFIVAPCFNAEVVKLTNSRLIPYMPGCGSMTEIATAQQAGCDVCKLFPADVLGTSFVKAVKGPMPWTNLMITGGVKPEEANIRGWFQAGASCVGMGSNLFPGEVLAAKDWAKITQLCKDALAIVKEVRK
ncbi:MAG: bifunctional 4-hydroxy-2-oxoglutarate aldolase/2-dehydro-3-deoxy-phosphogluconate aldolase [Paludibacteraceae bacterium]|nr:bifunctional 4-hydroxy-2-oxoglutarate aldolase/2-dehydro-3-deoxy-phosphogluconate aldolase [Paludibacteraceae bacterium]MBN2787253.1 bifunctional 4-hydroxy-2-oxoglutarate aldolase/2-dehydro-3-deoxy-phosphogluconate aldolase [Paludibacteraceae bacterium]